jgi:hypothetical protein
MEVPDLSGADVESAPLVESESLSDHEAAYAPGVDRAVVADPDRTPAGEPDEPETPAETAARERDESGRFAKPRHRAKSSQATVEDVPRIQELTRKLREAEAERDTLKQRTAAPPAERPAAETKPEPAAAPAGDKFPKWDAWYASNPDKDYDDYIDERSVFNYTQRRQQEQRQDAETAVRRSFSEQLPEVVKQYPDFHTLVSGAPAVSKVIERAVLEVGPHAAYYLATHHDEREGLTADTLNVSPDDRAFAGTVAAVKRHLSHLVSSSSPRVAAASTGSVPTLVRNPAPRPPNPVRTGAIKDADAAPSDDSSLADHERAFAPKRRRA